MSDCKCPGLPLCQCEHGEDCELDTTEAEFNAMMEQAEPATISTARTVTLSDRNDAGLLAFIVRDLMNAANYQFHPRRPLTEQAQECNQLIRDIRAMHDDLSTRIHIDSDRHEAEVQRLTDLVAELRHQLAGADRRIEQLGNTLIAYGSHPECTTCQTHGRACTIHGDPVNRSVATTETKP